MSEALAGSRVQKCSKEFEARPQHLYQLSYLQNIQPLPFSHFHALVVFNQHRSCKGNLLLKKRSSTLRNYGNKSTKTKLCSLSQCFPNRGTSSCMPFGCIWKNCNQGRLNKFWGLRRKF